jgi:poly(3-hydroxybutyrate) depolymerase
VQKGRRCCQMPSLIDHPFAAWSLFWPAMMVEEASKMSAAVARGLTNPISDPPQQRLAAEPGWMTANELVLELASVRLRRFGQSEKTRPILICAPFALHAATLTDIATGHSLVQALQAATQRPVYVTDWRSADPDMGSRAIDDYLADLNVLIDELGGGVDLVGLCQGGWMGLVYTARFPHKVHKLVLAGAPVDIAAGESELTRLARSTPIGVFKELVALGAGRILGRHLARSWVPQSLDVAEINAILQLEDGTESDALQHLATRFREWYGWTMDLPGRYYLQVVERIYLNNEIPTGRFVALGQRIDLSSVKVPIFVLAARDDRVVAPAQAFAVGHLVGTPPAVIAYAASACDHLGLFMGRQTLSNEWFKIGYWLAGSDPH